MVKRFISNCVHASLLLLCLGLCVGCEAKVADPVESEFTGEDKEAQMKAMEAVGRDQ
jgi:hypothetical protein